MADPIFFAVLQDSDAGFWPTSEPKSVPKVPTAPINKLVRHANPLFRLIERMIDGLDDVVWLLAA